MVSYLKAKLFSWRRINVVLFTDIPRPEKLKVSLYKEDLLVKKETAHFTSINNIYIFDINLDSDYELGKNYRLLVGDLQCTNIDVNDVIYFKDFDERFFYEKEDLGSNYTKEATEFVIVSK